MLNGIPILIAESDERMAVELAFAVEESKGIIVGPVSTVAGAMSLLDTQAVGAAIVNDNLLDGRVNSLTEVLIERAVPFVLQTACAMPARPRNPNSWETLSIHDLMSDKVIAHLLERLSLTRDKS
ncbi:hypothetical protein [Novosphingobium sp. AP12]|uniref:hypothetical protein n=1 Tax=Novosphingobium sp. AP12 TaxID=1144305 RepID=UPI000271F6D1|nr:hypothetical protein [Novosphingobium sp. AP12]EJL21212.1 hypothetical protein PMI02_05086 [Novosphingobium sp. AP12]